MVIKEQVEFAINGDARKLDTIYILDDFFHLFYI